MKKLAKIALVAAAFAPLMVFAQAGINPATLVPETTGLDTLINKIATWATGLLIALSVLFIIYAAFLYLTAASEPKNVDKAKDTITYAIIAIIIALLSQVVKGVVTALFK